jgi:hypothetical protein
MYRKRHQESIEHVKLIACMFEHGTKRTIRRQAFRSAKLAGSPMILPMDKLRINYSTYSIKIKYTVRKGQGNSVNITLWFGFKHNIHEYTRKSLCIFRLNPNHNGTVQYIYGIFCVFLSVYQTLGSGKLWLVYARFKKLNVYINYQNICVVLIPTLLYINFLNIYPLNQVRSSLCDTTLIVCMPGVPDVPVCMPLHFLLSHASIWYTNINK